MKKKSRQDPPDGKPPADDGQPAAPPPSEPPPATGAPAASAPATGTPAEPRRSLPAFGFASDLLKKAGDLLKGKSDAEPAAPAEPAAANEPSAAASEPSAAPALREVVDRDHLHGSVAERDRAEAVDEAELARTAGAFDRGLGASNDGPNRIFDFADRLAARAEERKSSGPKPRLETCLTFSLSGETFAMPVEAVQQIVRISSITRVPHAPRPIRGVTNLRGRVIPVIDLRVRVGLPAAEIDRSSRIIAVSSRNRVIGLLVDAVHQVMHIDLNLIQRPPDDVLTMQSDYIAGVYHHGESLILLLDVDRALIVRDSSAA